MNEKGINLFHGNAQNTREALAYVALDVLMFWSKLEQSNPNKYELSNCLQKFFCQLNKRAKKRMVCTFDDTKCMKQVTITNNSVEEVSSDGHLPITIFVEVISVAVVQILYGNRGIKKRENNYNPKLLLRKLLSASSTGRKGANCEAVYGDKCKKMS